MSTQATTSKPYTRIATGFFALLALGHLLRIAFGVEVIVDGTVVPVGVSLPVAVISAALAVLLNRESRGVR